MTSWSNLSLAQQAALDVVCDPTSEVLSWDVAITSVCTEVVTATVSGKAASSLRALGLVDERRTSACTSREITPTPEGLRVWKERE